VPRHAQELLREGQVRHARVLLDRLDAQRVPALLGGAHQHARAEVRRVRQRVVQVEEDGGDHAAIFARTSHGHGTAPLLGGAVRLGVR